MRAKVLAWIFLGSLGAAILVPLPSSGAAPAAVYDLRGVLQSFDPKTGQATIAHEAIGGYMPAMTMNFALADASEMRGLRPGDTLVCHLEVTPERAWIEGLHKENVPAVTSVGPLTASRATELKPGDLLPDIALLNERGKTVNVSEFGGSALAISFIYLRCPLPTYCPLMNRNFQAAQALLDRLGLKGRTHFLSVSLDPANDTPARLAEFAQDHAANPSTWTFAVAPEDALHQLGDAVGLEFQRSAGGINHNLRTVVLDPQRRIRRIFRGNAWTPQDLAAEMRAAVGAL